MNAPQLPRRVPASTYVTVGAVVVVAGIAAVVSYSHMQQYAAGHGEGWRSWLIPVSVDGLVVAASMVLLTRRRAGLPGGALAWGALGGGVLASLAANMADARPELGAVLFAGWAPVAFAVAFELLLQQRRAERANTPLGHSGNPAGRPDTVLPGRDSLAAPLSRPGPVDVEPVHSLDPGSGVDLRTAGRVVVAGPLPVPVRPEVLVRPTGAGQPVATNAATPPATTQAPRRDKAAPGGATKPATRARQNKPATAEQRRAWVRQQRDNGLGPTGSDVHKQFPGAPRDGARIVRQVDAELEAELRAVAAGER